MDTRYKTIKINNVGRSGDPLCVKVGRGVFNQDSLLDYLSHSIDSAVDDITIDLGQVGWIPIFDWCAFLSILHGQIRIKPELTFHLDFIGDITKDLIPYHECSDYFAGRTILPSFSDVDYSDSLAIYRVLNFVKSLEESSEFRNVAMGQIALSRVSSKVAGKRGYYRRNSDIENSIILPRINVESKEMCRNFANRNQVEKWREAMAAKRVPNAAVFQSYEFWRVLCHELARNVVEHAKGPGYIAGRIVLPNAGKLPSWCNDVYDEITLDQLGSANKQGFVELCVTDAGVGIPNTIELSYIHRYKERHRKALPINSVSCEDLLKFAFDELGTSKDSDRSWITDRHALGHILFIVEKYGGVLSVRSGNAALTYCPKNGKLKRCISQLGFEPQSSLTTSFSIPGTHLQLLLPLTPEQRDRDVSVRQSSEHPLTQSFHVDHRHPVGPLIPLRDKIGTLSTCIDGDDTLKFKEATRALARELLLGSHPRSQMLVFDFSEMDWVPAQFETFLYLMQNVFLNRLVLFTQMPCKFAKLVNSQEDEHRPSYLSETKWEDLQKREFDREFTEGKFLETYSALGALVLALGSDQGEYLFGVRNERLRTVLLKLINGEPQTINGLCDAYMLDAHVLSTVLHRASHLFKPHGNQRWGSVFVRDAALGRDDLEIQRLRAITDHFDIVAKQCDAWRGRKESGRYYLPTENTVYMEFFETSRILARERYVLEVAERLLYRICYGLKILPDYRLSLDDIDILACSTTPTVMLAEAIRRAWPAGQAGKRPVVIDYGPSLFAGADPAHIPSDKENHKLNAIVIQDLIDSGKLTRRLVALAEKQGIETIFILSFIRFQEAADKKTITFPPDAFWDLPHAGVGKTVHAMIGMSGPDRYSRITLKDWGERAHGQDYVVDPRSLRPVSLQSLRLESGYSKERSLTKRDSYLSKLDLDDSVCRLAAGHYVYGHRHFAVVVDIRGVLTGPIGYEITSWLADLCCGYKVKDVPWANEWHGPPLNGEISSILLPLHSQVRYILSDLQMELAQRDIRVPHFFLDATSFGGGVETYDIPYQLRDQLFNSAKNIKDIEDSPDTEEEKRAKIKKSQLRLLLIDDAIFSGRTVHTVLESLARHVSFITNKVYEGKVGKYKDGPIEWIRTFVVINQLPAARSALWHQLSSCSASSKFRFEEYAPFIGVATYSAADCPVCKQLEQLEQLLYRIKNVGLGYVATWIQDQKKTLVAISTEAPSFRKQPSKMLPVSIDVLALPVGEAPDRYKPLHVDSAIWRFYELIYLSYPLGDLLLCLQVTRKSGLDYPDYRDEYARFRLAVYEWCIQNWHQVQLYHAEKKVLEELQSEVEEGVPVFVDVIYRLSGIIQYEAVLEFVRWVIDSLAESDADGKRVASENTMNLDIALKLLFFSLSVDSLKKTDLLGYLKNKQALITRRSNFLSILFLLLTRPRVAAPGWALTTIAETCFRGRTGETAEERRTTDHDLLGRLVHDATLEPRNIEKRRRLESTLCAFIAAIENLQPYFDEDLLSPILSNAKTTRDWLQKPISEALENVTPIADLDKRMHDSYSWENFARNCHMPAFKFKRLLEQRLEELRKTPAFKNENNTVQNVVGGGTAHFKPEDQNPYNKIDLEVNVDPKIQGWCLMAHIPKLIACVSNIALEPVKKIAPEGSSQIFIKPYGTERPQSLVIEVFTRFGVVSIAREAVANSAKIKRSFDELELFGVKVEEPIENSESHDGGLRFTLEVPVGFQ